MHEVDSSLIRAIPFCKKVINFRCLFFIEIENLIFQWIMAKKYRQIVARWHSTYFGCKQVRFAVVKQVLYVTERASFLYLNKHCSQTLCLLIMFLLFFNTYTIFSLFLLCFHYFLLFSHYFHYIFTIFHYLFHFFHYFHYVFSTFLLFSTILSLPHPLFFTIFSLFPLFFLVALLKQ
jgi:hypothetical protein